MSEGAYIPRIDRRTAMAWMGVVAAATAVDGGAVLGARAAEAKGYGSDPVLNPPAKSMWPRLLTRDQLQAAAALSDFILPASGTAPSASSLGIPDFFDEWVSAPYPNQVADRPLLVEGLTALAAALKDPARRGGALAAQVGSPFFKRFRYLTIGAYYTTEAGFKDIGYIGNVARASDPGPSAEVKAAVERELKKLGL
mgnify:FL=1